MSVTPSAGLVGLKLVRTGMGLRTATETLPGVASGWPFAVAEMVTRLGEGTWAGRCRGRGSMVPSSELPPGMPLTAKVSGTAVTTWLLWI